MAGHRWTRISLRTFLVMVILLGSVVGWLGIRARRIRDRHNAVKTVKELGGSVRHATEANSSARDPFGTPPANAKTAPTSSWPPSAACGMIAEQPRSSSRLAMIGSSLQQQLQGAEQTATESAQLIESLQQQLSELKAHPEEPIGPATQSVELTYWHYLAIALLLLLSFIGGILFKKRRISRRYGGLRV